MASLDRLCALPAGPHRHGGRPTTAWRRVSVAARKASNTTTPAGRLVFHVFAALAEFIRELIVEETPEGLDAARVRGRVGGGLWPRPPQQPAGKRLGPIVGPRAAIPVVWCTATCRFVPRSLTSPLVHAVGYGSGSGFHTTATPRQHIRGHPRRHPGGDLLHQRSTNRPLGLSALEVVDTSASSYIDHAGAKTGSSALSVGDP